MISSERGNDIPPPEKYKNKHRRKGGREKGVRMQE